MKNPNDNEVVVRKFISFISQYCQLLELQLEDIRNIMLKTVEEEMKGIENINEKHVEQKTKAESVLVRKYTEDKKSLQEGFCEKNSKILEKDENHILKDQIAKDAGYYSDEINKAGFQLKNHMSSLKDLDQKVEQVLMGMMGALSSDDIIGQRLTHVSSAVECLRDGLREVFLDLEKKLNVEEIKKIHHKNQKKTYDSYTMEEEKQQFLKVYDKPPED